MCALRTYSSIRARAEELHEASTSQVPVWRQVAIRRRWCCRRARSLMIIDQRWMSLSWCCPSSQKRGTSQFFSCVELITDISSIHSGHKQKKALILDQNEASLSVVCEYIWLFSGGRWKGIGERPRRRSECPGQFITTKLLGLGEAWWIATKTLDSEELSNHAWFEIA